MSGIIRKAHNHSGKPKKKRKRIPIKPSELVKFLNHLFVQSPTHRGTRLKVDQIKKPTKEVVRKIYEILISEILGINPNKLSAQSEQALKCFSIEQLHEQSRKEVALFFNTKQMLHKLRQKDFDLHDIHEPRWAKLKYHLAEAVNFLNFRKKFQKKAEKVIEEQNGRKEKIEKLKEEKKEIAEDQVACNNEIAEDASKVSELPEILEGSRKLALEHTQLKNKQSRLTTEKNQKQARYQFDALQNEKMEDRLGRLESSVAEDPKKIKQEVTRLEEENERSTLILKQAKQKYEGLIAAKKREQEARKHLITSIKSLREVRECRRGEDATGKDLKELQKIQASFNREKIACNKRTKELQSREHQEGEKNSLCEGDHRKELQRFQDKKTQADAIDRQFQTALAEHRKSIQDKNDEILRIKETMKNLKIEWDKYEKEIEALVKEYRKEIKRYVEDLKYVQQKQNWSGI